MARRERIKRRILTTLMIGTVLSVVGYGTAVAANVVHMPLGDPENPNPSPSPGASYVLTVHLAGSGHGHVESSEDGIDCGLHCTGSFVAGQAVTLEADPADHSTFEGWSGACSGKGSCSVEMTQARSVTATFGVEEEELTVARVGHGHIMTGHPGIHCPGDCSQAFSHGKKVHLYAHPAGGWHLAFWKGGCSGHHGCTVGMKGARHVTAKFAHNHTH